MKYLLICLLLSGCGTVQDRVVALAIDLAIQHAPDSSETKRP